MSEINNIDSTELEIHLEFHCLAAKYQIDVDTISEIITDWEDWKKDYKKKILPELTKTQKDV